ncbi:MAG: TIGR03618 family F420-dependent PPOX class oxidoreductase [Dehalococcoidia bacterium]
MTDAEREAFLASPRLGILATLRSDGFPVALPVWFEWDGSAARIFTSVASAKVKRLKRDPRASLLVANAVGEKEAWVAFDGRVTINRDGGYDLAERLAKRYWGDLSQPERKQTMDEWREIADTWRVLELAPGTIRTS